MLRPLGFRDHRHSAAEADPPRVPSARLVSRTHWTAPWVARDLLTGPRVQARTLTEALASWRRVARWWYYTPGELGRMCPMTADLAAGLERSRWWADRPEESGLS